MTKTTVLRLVIISLSLLVIMVFVYSFVFDRGGAGNKGSAGPPYNFAEPAAVITLPEELAEISGITYHSDKTLACVEDEQGILADGHGLVHRRLDDVPRLRCLGRHLVGIGHVHSLCLGHPAKNSSRVRNCHAAGCTTRGTMNYTAAHGKT